MKKLSLTTTGAALMALAIGAAAPVAAVTLGGTIPWTDSAGA